MAEGGLARSVREFLEHAERAGAARPRDLAREHVTGWIAAEERRGLGARSRARALVAVRRYARWLLATGALKRDPTLGVLPPRLAPRLPRGLGGNEVEALLAATDPATPLGLRDRAML